MDTDLPLSGPMSTRRLGTESGVLKRSAMRLRRGGYREASEKMALAAEQSRVSGGSRITSADSNRAVKRQTLGGQSVLAGQRASMLRESEAARMGASGVQGSGGVQGASPMQSRIGNVNTPGLDTNPVRPMAAPAPAAAPAPMATPAAPAAPAAAMAPRGTIDGKPVGSVLSGMRAATENPNFKPPAEDATSRAPGGTTFRSVLDQVRENAASSGRTRIDELDAINAARRQEGKTDIKISGQDYADADVAGSALASAQASEATRDESVLAGIRSNNVKKDFNQVTAAPVPVIGDARTQATNERLAKKGKNIDAMSAFRRKLVPELNR